MKLLALILLGLVCAVSHGYAADANTASGLPPEVAEFKKRRDLCDHFRGEDPYNEERRKFLEQNMKKFCAGIDRELALLKIKYKENEVALNVLASYEEKIEGSK